MIVVGSALLLHLLEEPGYPKCRAPSALVRPYVARAVRDRDPVITKSVALGWNVGNVSAKPTTRKRH